MGQSVSRARADWHTMLNSSCGFTIRLCPKTRATKIHKGGFISFPKQPFLGYNIIHFHTHTHIIYIYNLLRSPSDLTSWLWLIMTNSNSHGKSTHFLSSVNHLFRLGPSTNHGELWMSEPGWVSLNILCFCWLRPSGNEHSLPYVPHRSWLHPGNDHLAIWLLLVVFPSGLIKRGWEIPMNKCRYRWVWLLYIYIPSINIHMIYHYIYISTIIYIYIYIIHIY